MVKHGVPSELCSQGVSVTRQFIADHLNDDVNFLALHAKQYPDVDIAFALRQIEGRQKARHKLPTLSANPDWLFPQSLAVEQCSSEATALFKQQIVSSLLSGSADSQLSSMVDLTGGFGIDCYFLSELFCRSVYVERQEELCRLARHNFSLSGREIEVVNADATDYAQTMQPATLIYLDPARRSKNGEKVFLIDDLEPNVKQLLPVLSQKGRLLMIKLSPMLDIQRLLSDLQGVSELFVLAVANEVKELLAVIDTLSLSASSEACDTGSPQSFARKGCHTGSPQSFARKGCQYDPTIHAVNLTSSGNHHFSFTLQQEKQARCEYATEVMTYIYEPDNALMKAGCYKLLSEKYGLLKLDPSSHLYTSLELCRDFQGRVFRVKGIADKKQLSGCKANILARNYPLSAPQIKQKYKIIDDDDEYLIATRINGKPIILSATKL